MDRDNLTEKKFNSVDERIKREKEWHNRLAKGEFSDVFHKKLNHGSVFYKCHDILETYTNRELDGNKIVLDYCCGAEGFLIRNALNVKEGIGIDISDVLIDRQNGLIARENIRNLKFMVMDAMNTTFTENTFDVIHGEAVLHHLDLEKSIYEIHRILKYGGKAFFQEPLGTNPVIALYRKMTPKYRTVDERAFTIKDIKLIKKYFSKFEIEFYLCFTLLAFPFRNKKIFRKAVDFLFRIDKIFLHKRSPFKWLAWCCIINLQK